MVSVIIPTYKRDKYIVRAVNSVLGQTYKELEVIVVDDNDPDTEYRKNMEKRMEIYKNNDRVIYLKHDRNRNGAAARNTGIKVAKGDYITFLDDDDYFISNRLELMVEALEKNLDYDCAYSSNIVTKNKKIMGKVSAIKSGNLKKELLSDDFSFGSGSNMFFRAEVLKKLNGFNESFIRHQDIETMVRFFDIGKLLAVDKYLLVKNEDDRSNEPNIDKLIDVKKHYIEIFKDIIDKFSLDDRKHFYKQAYLNIINTSVRLNKKDVYRKYAKEVEKYGKLTFKEKIYHLMLKINRYIKIENIKYLFMRIKLNMELPKKLKEEIKYYENFIY